MIEYELVVCHCAGVRGRLIGNTAGRSLGGAKRFVLKSRFSRITRFPNRETT